MGSPEGMSTIRSTRLVLEIWSFRLILYISGVKGDHHYFQTRHNDIFSHYNLFLGKFKEKLARKARVNTDASI